MKRILITCFVVVALVACNGGGSKDESKKEEVKKEEPKKEEEKVDSGLSDNPVYQKGFALAAKSDCFTCHKVDEPLTGPSYREVANKYASYSDTIVAHLAGKIITGGNGVWGQVPMTPHTGMPEDDAKAMVKYILLLKK